MGALQLAFLNVGQGDTIIIYDPDSKEAVVVDCINCMSVFEFCEAKGINHLRALILTHPHTDHYLGAIGLLNSCERRGITLDSCIFRWDKDFLRIPELLGDSDGHSDMVCNKERRKSNYQALVSWATQPANKRKHIEPHELPKGSRILNALNFLHPKHRDMHELFQTGNLNNLSYVIQVSDGSKALLTGDIEPAGWTFLRDNHVDLLASAVLKFPHHGVWRNGDISQLMKEVKPQFVIISVGTKNTYGHPTQEVFEEIRKYKNVRLLCTQATSQCVKNPEEVRNTALELLKTQTFFLPSQRKQLGCPCAGTIIIELGENARVISPNIGLHIHQIIKPYMKTRQCAV